MQTKVCRKCGEEKELTEFYKHKTNTDGLSGSCKICLGVYQKKWREENPGYTTKYAAKVNEWREKNPEKYKSQRKLYREKNRDKIKEKDRSYRERNKEKIALKAKKWREANLVRVKKQKSKYYRNGGKEKVIARVIRRRARTPIATPNWLKPLDHLVMQHIYKTCPEGYHVDHIVPLQGKTVSGLHVPWNLQYLTSEENLSKGNRWWPDMWEEPDEQET